jgi:hypothetical protein
MLSTEATAMAGLSGVNLGTILTALVNLTSGTIIAYIFIDILLISVLFLAGSWDLSQFRYYP